MRRSLLHVALAVVLFLSAPAGAQDALFSVFGNYLESLRAQAGIPGMVAVIVGPQNIVWQRAYGQQDVEHSVATRLDTPFHVNGLTQVFTTALILRCVEEGRLSLDARVGQYTPNSPDANATIAEILTHTSGPANDQVFSYNPPRLDSLAYVMSACEGEASREMLSDLLDRLAMTDSVPGPDAIDLVPPYEGVTASAIARYAAVLRRLATPYNVDASGHATPSRYVVTTVKPSDGLITTAPDLARFDLALKQSILLKPDTLAAAWRPPVDRTGRALPHGMGWFAQSYNGRQVLWQFGVAENASSSLMVMVPSQGLTLFVLANSDGLVKPFALAAGDLTVSPFGRVFLSTFAR